MHSLLFEKKIHTNRLLTYSQRMTHATKTPTSITFKLPEDITVVRVHLFSVKSKIINMLFQTITSQTRFITLPKCVRYNCISLYAVTSVYIHTYSQTIVKFVQTFSILRAALLLAYLLQTVNMSNSSLTYPLVQSDAVWLCPMLSWQTMLSRTLSERKKLQLD